MCPERCQPVSVVRWLRNCYTSVTGYDKKDEDMNPFFSTELAEEHIRDLQREAGAARIPEEPGEHGHNERVTVRAMRARDVEQVRVLSALDSRHMPRGPVLVAEQDGEVVAALPLDGSRAIADPFRRTSDLVALLELRARQVTARSRHGIREALADRLRGTVAPTPRAA
jgi:hypothetical protein